MVKTPCLRLQRMSIQATHHSKHLFYLWLSVYSMYVYNIYTHTHNSTVYTLYTVYRLQYINEYVCKCVFTTEHCSAESNHSELHLGQTTELDSVVRSDFKQAGQPQRLQTPKKQGIPSGLTSLHVVHLSSGGFNDSNQSSVKQGVLTNTSQAQLIFSGCFF